MGLKMSKRNRNPSRTPQISDFKKSIHKPGKWQANTSHFIKIRGEKFGVHS